MHVTLCRVQSKAQPPSGRCGSITSSGRWKETVLLWEYIGILPLECKRGLAQSSRYFCSHSKEVLKGNQRTVPQSWMLLRPLLRGGDDCAVTVTDLRHAVHRLFECATKNCINSYALRKTQELRNTSPTYRCFNISSNKNVSAS